MLGKINSNIFSYQNCKRQSPTFTGKKFVQMKLYGDKYLVPRAVADVRKCVKQSFLEISDVDLFSANAVNIKDNIFVGVAHFLDEMKTLSLIAIGKITNKKEYLANEVYKHTSNESLDLAAFYAKIKNRKSIAKSSPIKFAEKLPQKGETVYIVGYHGSYSGPKAIPAIFATENISNLFQGQKYGSAAQSFKAHAFILKDKINPIGLSGAAVVNEKGELIGIQKAANVNERTDLCTGEIFCTSIDTIKSFLEELK